MRLAARRLVLRVVCAASCTGLGDPARDVAATSVTVSAVSSATFSVASATFSPTERVWRVTAASAFSARFRDVISDGARRETASAGAGSIDGTCDFNCRPL